jgi:hypothetical protein
VNQAAHRLLACVLSGALLLTGCASAGWPARCSAGPWWGLDPVELVIVGTCEAVVQMHNALVKPAPPVSRRANEPRVGVEHETVDNMATPGISPERLRRDDALSGDR